jgi:hypothetical protein
MHVGRRTDLGTNFGGRIVVHEKCEGLARNIGYPNIVENLRVIERNFSGDYEVRVTRMRSQNETGQCEKIELRCITPREMARLCIGAFMITTRGRVSRDVEEL